MSEIYETGSEGVRLLTAYLHQRGRTVASSDTKTFDLIVDGRYAEVKSSRAPYAKLGFIGLTDAQFKALNEGVDFRVFVVCNTSSVDAIEVLELSASDLRTEKPKVESTYYWYRSQLERCRRPTEDQTSH